METEFRFPHLVYHLLHFLLQLLQSLLQSLLKLILQFLLQLLLELVDHLFNVPGVLLPDGLTTCSRASSLSVILSPLLFFTMLPNETRRTFWGRILMPLMSHLTHHWFRDPDADVSQWPIPEEPLEGMDTLGVQSASLLTRCMMAPRMLGVISVCRSNTRSQSMQCRAVSSGFRCPPVVSALAFTRHIQCLFSSFSWPTRHKDHPPTAKRRFAYSSAASGGDT